MFIDSLKEVSFYSSSFDESYNNVLKKGKWIYMPDMEDTNIYVVKRYLDSSFMGKSSANDIVYNHF